MYFEFYDFYIFYFYFKFNAKLLCRALFALLNIIKEIILVPGYIENWLVIIDLDGFIDKKETIQKLYEDHLEELINVFQMNYPNYLEKLYFINFPHTFLDLLHAFRQKITASHASFLRKMEVLSKDELKNLQEKIDGSQIEKKYGGTYPNYQTFWPPRNIINSRSLRLLIPKKELKSEVICLHESEEEAPRRKKLPKFKDLSYSPLRIADKAKINRKNMMDSMKIPAKFKNHDIFEKKMPKQFLLDDWESVASSSSRISNPMKSRQNRFIEDFYQKQPCFTENYQVLGGSQKKESTKELYQSYFDEKYKKKLNESKNKYFFF